MKICLPVTEDLGIKSPLCPHFGSAPLFLLVESDSLSCRALPNQQLHQGHGQCLPLAALQGEQLDVMIVGGIGMGAVAKLRAAGIEVYLSQHPTAEEALIAWRAGLLQSVTQQTACAQHAAGQGQGAGGCQGQGHA